MIELLQATCCCYNQLCIQRIAILQLQAVWKSGYSYTTMVLYIRCSKIIFGVPEMDLDRQSNRTFHLAPEVSLECLRNFLL